MPESLNLCKAASFPAEAAAQVDLEPETVQVVIPTGSRQEMTMLKGGLLWLIGIPLPIILILFFMGWLS